jgi:DNA polymerase-3 subunit delta'
MLLERIVGQDPAVATLRRALATDRLPHAYLFDGPDGVGKRSAALGLGLALVCDRAPGVGCGACDACTRVASANHPDVWCFDAPTLKALAKERGDMSQVDYAREHVFPYALRRPHEARARLFVIDHADDLNEHAQNALLKTLEEPRAGVHIVLVTAAPAGLLTTVRSRTQRVRFRALGPAAVVCVLRPLLVAQGLDPAGAEATAALSGGSVARALALAEAKDDVGLWHAVARLREAAAARDLGTIFSAAQELGGTDEKARLPEVLTLLARVYRDAIAHRSGAGDLALLGQHAAELATLGASAAELDLRTAARAALEAQAALEANLNPVSVLERLLLTARACERRAAR